MYSKTTSEIVKNESSAENLKREELKKDFGIIKEVADKHFRYLVRGLLME